MFHKKTVNFLELIYHFVPYEIRFLINNLQLISVQLCISVTLRLILGLYLIDL